MNKEGVSAVVATVLIVMITVAAVGLLWGIIAPFLKTNIADKTACVEAEMAISIDTGSKYTCVSAENGTAIRVSRGSDDNDWKSVQVIYTDSFGGSEKVNYAFPPEKNSEKVYYNVNLTDVVSISVVPILEGDGKDLICSKTINLPDVKECTSLVEDTMSETSRGYVIDKGAVDYDNPVITGLVNQQIYTNESFALAFDASDDVGIDSIFVNDSSFGISGSYVLVNSSIMLPKTYSVLVTAKDAAGNSTSQVISIEGSCGSGVEYFNALCIVNELLAYWQFNDDTQFNDTSGNGHRAFDNGSAYGFGTNTPQIVDNFLAVDGEGDWLYVDNWSTVENPFPSGTEDFSISVWMKTSSSKEWAGIVAKGWGEGRMWITLKLGELRFNTYFGDPDGNSSNGYLYDYWMSTGAQLNDSIWHHIVGTMDRDGLQKVYVDGVFLNATDISPASHVLWNNKAFMIGSFTPWSDRFLNGSIDEVASFDKVLTEDEIQEIFNAGR